MNAIDLLKEDHDRVEALFEKFKQNEDGNNGALAKQIRGELETHTHIEEKIFYPAAMKRGKADLKKIIREGLEEHAQVKDLLADLKKMTPRNKQFNAKLTVVVENVEHHVEEEEDDMFPLCKDQMSSKQLEQLGAEMEEEKLRFQKANGIKPAPQAKPSGIGAMVGKAAAAVGNLLGGDQKTKTKAPKSKAKTNSRSSDRSGRASAAKSNGKAKSSSASKANGRTSGRSKSTSSKTEGSKRKPSAKSRSANR